MHPSNPWDASQETVREQVDLLQLHLEVVRLEVVDLLIRRLEVVDLLIRSLPTPSSGHGPHQKDRKRPSRPKDEPKSKKVRKKTSNLETNKKDVSPPRTSERFWPLK